MTTHTHNHTHEWVQTAAFSHIYYCHSCGVFGHRKVLCTTLHTTPYICSIKGCRNPAVGQDYLTFTRNGPRYWRCIEHRGIPSHLSITPLPLSVPGTTAPKARGTGPPSSSSSSSSPASSPSSSSPSLIKPSQSS